LTPPTLHPQPGNIAREPTIYESASTNPVDDRLTHLDLVRGLAAIAVCAGRLRFFLFVDWPQIEGTVTGLDFIVYFCTSLGHQAVIAFFVVSGILEGGIIAASCAKGAWSVTGYAFRRIARLETVLIPALHLTLFWDNLGNILTNGVGYDGSLYQVANSGPSIDTPLANGLIPFLGNVTFLMTIKVPVYGTNGPLWSLANDFLVLRDFPTRLDIVIPLRNA
jgi:peptidoglycan/LPS O-acetylase OafA/YrhL